MRWIHLDLFNYQFFFATLILFISLAWFYTWANKLEVSQDITLRTFQLNLEWNAPLYVTLFTSHDGYIIGWCGLYRWVVGKSPRKCAVQVPMPEAGYHYPVVSWDPRHQQAWDWALRLTWHWADTGGRLEPGGWALHSGMQCWRPRPSHPARQPGTMQQN